jgi:hypothetical protein
MTFRLCLAVLVSAALLPIPPARAADERLPDAPPLPILAWAGPPEQQCTPERLKELAEAGFTHNLSSVGSADGMAKVLDVAKAVGVKMFVTVPELASDPEGTAKRFKGHPALAGYSLRDEPSAGDFDGLAKWARRIQSVDPDHPCYINLYPNYCPAAALGNASYREHVAQFVKQVPVPLLSFDHYPIVGESVRPEWYENLEIVSAAAREANKPFWAFALATAHGAYPVPTAAQLRLQAYSDLAYGAQGLEYFTYWTPTPGTWDFHDGPITPDGKRTVVYERVREVNRELQAIRGVFVGSRVISLGHTGKEIPAGTRRYEPREGVKSLETEGKGAVVSVLEKGGRRFLVVVNRDMQAAMKLRVGTDAAAGAKRVDKDGTLRALGDGGELRAEVGPGDVAIVTWKRR